MKLSCIFPTVVAVFSLPIITPVFTAAVSNPWRNGSLALPGLNFTSLNVPPDPRLRIRRVYSEDEIVKNDCLVVGLWLMGQLATKDWSSSIASAQGPHLANFPGVNISIQSEEPFTHFPIEYAIWGLKLAILDLLVRDRFVESIYELSWDHVAVGTIYIQRVQNTRASTSRQSLDGKENNLSLIIPLAVNQPISLAIERTPGAQPINPRDIWITMFDSQERLAYPEAYAIPRVVFQIGPYLPISSAFLKIDPIHGPDLPRLYPPFLHVSTICHTLMLIAVWMCLNNYFSDFMFSISVGGILVGGGRVGGAQTASLEMPSGGLIGSISTS